MSNFETPLYSPYNLSSPEGGLDVVQKGSTRIAPASYDRRMKEVLAFHTGSSETYLTIEQEQELAVLIQKGQAAQAELADLEARRRLGVRQQARREAALASVNAGKEAEGQLIGCHLRFGSYLAKASMNILPAGDQQALAEDAAHTKAGIRRRALLNDRHPWLPRDFTSLKSRHAVLDDRIQVANLGLIKAARTFTPGIRREKDGRLLPFRSFAAPIIKTELARYVIGGRPDSHEKPVHIPANVVEGVARARRDNWQDYFTPEQREELLAYDQLQDTTSWEELYFAGAADEEVDRDGQEPPLLWAAEVIADDQPIDPFETVAALHRKQLLKEALATLSEREAEVLRLRYGISDGVPRTFDEVGLVYGISRERVRQIEIKALGKMRHPSRSRLLRDYVDLKEGGSLPMHSGDIIKVERTVGSTTLRLMTTTPEREAPQSTRGRAASWQAYPGEPWDEPVRKSEAQLEAEYLRIGDRLREAVFGASLYTFQKSFAESVDSPYPKILVDHIIQTFGGELRPEHVADFWNDHLESFLQHLSNNLGEDTSFDRATQLLSRLLAERMGDNDTVELHIPESLQGKLGYVGAWLAHGVVQVKGSVANYAGYQMSSLGHLQIDGSVGHFAGQAMSGHARLDIDGNAKDFLGSGMRGNASILTNGNVGDYCGHRMRSPGVLIEVMGDTGGYLGFEATNGEVVIGGRFGHGGTSGQFKGQISRKKP